MRRRREIDAIAPVRRALATMPGGGAFSDLRVPDSHPEYSAEEWLRWLAGYLERLGAHLRQMHEERRRELEELHRFQLARSGLRFLLQEGD